MTACSIAPAAGCGLRRGIVSAPPPSGNGAWTEGETQAVKDRWVCALRPDAEREALLAVADEALQRKMPWASFREPTWRRGVAHGGGGDFKRWRAEGGT